MAGTTRRAKIWVSAAGAVVLLSVVLTSLLLLGSTDTPSSAQTASASPRPSSAAPGPAPAAEIRASATQALPSASLHERVMAEQGRGAAARASAGKTMSEARSLPSAGTTSPEATESSAPVYGAERATAAVSGEGQTPLRGVWSGTAEQLAAYLLTVCPEPRFTVSALALAEYYIYYCADAGLRADLLWAQMIHETGYGRYGGDVAPEQNNYAGLGATGGGEPGIWFVTAEAGVMAHIAHMVAYVYASSPVEWANAATDPRFDLVSPRGATVVLADLNGRWAVPGTTYGQSIETIAQAINGG